MIQYCERDSLHLQELLASGLDRNLILGDITVRGQAEVSLRDIPPDGRGAPRSGELFKDGIPIQKLFTFYILVKLRGDCHNMHNENSKADPSIYQENFRCLTSLVEQLEIACSLDARMASFVESYVVLILASPSLGPVQNC